MNEAQGSSGKKPLLNDGFVNVDYHRPDQPDREDLRYLDNFQRRGSESVSDDRDPAKNNDSSYPVNIAAHDDSSLRSPNSASRQTHAPASRLRSLPDGQGEVTVKLTPITGRVSRARKGVPVHTCEICRPPKTFTRPEHLRRHQLSHQTPQYPCTFPGCERAFHRADLLARHATRHELEGDKASSRSGTGDTSRSDSTTSTGSGTPYYKIHTLPEPGKIVTKSFAECSSGISEGLGKSNNYNLPGVRDTDIDESREQFTPSTKLVLLTSTPADAGSLSDPYQEHQKETNTVDHFGCVDGFTGGFVNLDRPTHGYLGEPKPTTLRPNLSVSTNSRPPNNLDHSLSTTSGIVFANQYDFGTSLSTAIQPHTESKANTHGGGLYIKPNEKASFAAQQRILSEASPGSPDPSNTAPEVSGRDSPIVSSASNEEIVNRYRFVPGKISMNPSTNATNTIKDYATISTHPMDTGDLATDSGYGSVQARAGRAKLIRDALAKTRADSSHHMAESHTVYSKASTIRSTEVDFYISEIAEELAAILPRSLPKELMVALRSALPHLLEASVIRWGYSESGPVGGRLMYFVHKYRERIAEAVTKVFAFEEEDEQTKVPDLAQAEDMTMEDKMLLWQKQQDLPDDCGQDRLPWDDGHDAIDEFEDFAGLQEYCGVLIRSTAFTWLQNAMLREIQMEVVGDFNAQADIRDQILTALGKEERISRQQPPKTHRLCFSISELRAFFAMQEYDLPAHEALPRVLVLTGIDNQAWATTCLEYVRMLWPQSGEKILSLFIFLLCEGLGASTSCILDDDTQLTATALANRDNIEVLAVGNAFAIAEVGEMLAWFQAAFWLSPEDQCVVSIVPTCEIMGKLEPTLFGPLTEVRCMLALGKPKSEAEDNPNCCWMKLLRNPILIRGYPIPRHAQAHGGIELSVGTMTELLGTRKVSMFSGKPLFKTAISALVPLYRKNDFIYWHMVARPDWEYLSYCDILLKPFLDKAPSDLSLADIGGSRHILGWSANVKNVTGGPSAKFDIGWSGLKRPSPGCVLEKISIVGGSYITAGVSCVLGRKDKAVHIRSRDDYTMRLKWIAKKYVVLYDVVDRRAWLVDGTSALLHLVRASLKYDAADDFKSLLLYDPNALQEAPENRFGKTASIQVLTNPHNVSLRLYSKPETSREETILGISDATRPVTTRTQTYYCFQDRVQGISDVLEQIMAHQADESTQDGIGFRFKASPRRQLEGFDFMDVATDEDPFWPRMTTLRATGRGWVDFTRAIHAVTLFGTGFGDLIQPIEPENGSVRACEECLLNSTVPKGQDSLAVCVSELQEILQKRGSTKTSPWRLVDDLYWHTPDKVFEACQCNKKSSPKHERMQVLLPSSIPKFWSRGLSSPIYLSLRAVSNGAVLFGHSRRFPLRWQDHGLPEEGPPNIEIEDIESSVHDSGLGSSISSSGADNTQDSASSRSPLSFSSLNEGGKRDCRQALLSTSVEDVEGSMAKRKKVERGQAEEPAVPQREIGAGNGGAGASSSRISNFMESMARWKHMEK